MKSPKIFTLGLLETACCTTVVLIFAWWTQSWTYVAIWSLLGWTQMLRTRRSTVLGLRWFAPVFNWIAPGLAYYYQTLHRIGGSKVPAMPDSNSIPDSKSALPNGSNSSVQESKGGSGSNSNPFKGCAHAFFPHYWMFIALIAALLGLGAVILLTVVVLAAAGLTGYAAGVRALSTSVLAILHPCEALRAIPSNWHRVSWSSELFAPLEFVPRHGLLRRLHRASREEGAGASSFAVFRPFRFAGTARPALVGIGCLAGAALLAWPAVAVFQSKQAATQKASWLLSEDERKMDQAYEEIGVPEIPVFSENEIDELGARSNVPKEQKHEGEGAPDAVRPQEKSEETSINKYLEIADLELADDSINAPKAPRRNSKLPIGIFSDPFIGEFPKKLTEEREKEIREQLRKQFQYNRPGDFDVLEFGSWLLWSEYLSHWPVRALGEGKITGWMASILRYLLLAVGFVLVAVYFGLCAFIILIALATPLRGVLFLPALMYRFSLKASAMTYAPLFFVIEAPYIHDSDPLKAFREVQKHWVHATMRGVAKIFAAVLLVNIALAVLVPTIKAQLVARFSEQVVDILRSHLPEHLRAQVPEQLSTQMQTALLELNWKQLPEQLPEKLSAQLPLQVQKHLSPALNQKLEEILRDSPVVKLLKLAATWSHPLSPTNIASAIVLLSTFVVWALTKRALFKAEEKIPQSLGLVAGVVRTLDRLKSMLSIYTISCAIFWAATVLFPAIKIFQAPEFQWIFLPWDRH